MATSSVFKADISRFRSSAPVAYSGKDLIQVNSLKRSIRLFGLFAPITVQRVGATLAVIDGKKRLAALTYLIKTGVIPRDLAKVPYVIVVNARARQLSTPGDYLPLLSNRQKYHLLIRLVEAGKTSDQIAHILHCPAAYVKKLGSVAKLSRKLKQAYAANTLSLAQAEAFSTLTTPKAQDKLLDLLGPFASAPTILKAIHSGQAVVECGEDNIIIMPSRGRPAKRRVCAA